MKDYAPLLALAKRLVRDKGRTITLKAISTTAEDPDKPWRGPEERTVSKTTAVSAVSVPPSSMQSLGISIPQEDLLKRLEVIYIVEPGEQDPEDLGQYQVITDEGKDLRIGFLEQLKPANLTLLYFIGAMR